MKTYSTWVGGTGAGPKGGSVLGQACWGGPRKLMSGRDTSSWEKGQLIDRRGRHEECLSGEPCLWAGAAESELGPK